MHEMQMQIHYGYSDFVKLLDGALDRREGEKELVSHFDFGGPSESTVSENSPHSPLQKPIARQRP